MPFQKTVHNEFRFSVFDFLFYQVTEQVHAKAARQTQTAHGLGADAEIISVGFRRDLCLGLAVIIDNSQVDAGFYSIGVGLAALQQVIACEPDPLAADPFR